MNSAAKHELSICLTFWIKKQFWLAEVTSSDYSYYADINKKADPLAFKAAAASVFVYRRMKKKRTPLSTDMNLLHFHCADFDHESKPTFHFFPCRYSSCCHFELFQWPEIKSCAFIRRIASYLVASESWLIYPFKVKLKFYIYFLNYIFIYSILYLKF